MPSMHACCQDDFEEEEAAEAPIPSLNEVLNSALHAGTAAAGFGAQCSGTGRKTAKCRAPYLHARWQASELEPMEEPA